MQRRHQKKALKFRIARYAMALILVLTLSVSSLATVMANTVPANVIDGENSYSFSMNSTDLEAIIAQAESLGLEPLGPLDAKERVGNTTTVNIRRGVRMSVSEAGQSTEFVAYRGDTVEKALLDNNILLKEKDEVTPARDAEVTGDLNVEIKRSCSVSVTADGKTHKVSLTGGTVEEAIGQAGVKLEKDDSVNYSMEEPLFENMNIRVTRTMQISVTADGETKSYRVSAENVAAALEKCGVELSEDDQLNYKRKEKVVNGMHVIVQRVTTEETTVTEPVAYETVTKATDALYEGETEVETAGVEGEKEVTYKLIYVEGELQNKEAVEEKVTREPVDEVVLQGTKERPSNNGSTNAGNGGGSSGGVGTFVDMDGNVVSYTSMLSGTCTAYSVPGGTTSIGMNATYGVIAVNPNIIPYGTRMYVTSPDGSVVYGYGVAGDTGGACMAGDIIADLCYNTIEECSIIGRRTMNVYILG